MKNYQNIKVIGIDHGYGNMKTANCCFPTGVLKSETEPTFGGDVLIWNGRYSQIGAGHKAFSAEKMLDEDYYALTLAAIARELGREKTYVVGGGGALIQNFAEYGPDRVTINGDICATAKGYECMAEMRLLRGDKL